jgi:hypothetical protein
MMISLAIVFIAGFVSMVTSAYCADHIHRSSASATDANLKMAYEWAWGTAVLGALIAAGSLVTIGYYLFVKK